MRIILGAGSAPTVPTRLAPRSARKQVIRRMSAKAVGVATTGSVWTRARAVEWFVTAAWARRLLNDRIRSGQYEAGHEDDERNHASHDRRAALVRETRDALKCRTQLPRETARRGVVLAVCSDKLDGLHRLDPVRRARAALLCWAWCGLRSPETRHTCPAISFVVSSKQQAYLLSALRPASRSA